MKSLKGILTLTTLAFALVVRAETVYNNPHTGTGTLNASSWVWEEGSDSDFYSYESFILPQTTDVKEVSWRGGYQYIGYGSAFNFHITFYDSIAGGSQPHCGNPQFPETDFSLANYYTGDAAGETAVGVFGGTTMYDYHATLPTAFHAVAGHKYWVKIEGLILGTYPAWGLASGVGDNSNHFTFSTGAAQFRNYPNDLCIGLGDSSQTMPVQYYVVQEGVELSGNLSSLFSSDNNALVVMPDDVTLGATVDFVSEPTSNLNSQAITVTVEFSANRSGLSVVGSLLNSGTGQFDPFLAGVCPTTDVEHVLQTNNPAYLDAGQMTLRLHWQPINDEDPSQDGWGHLVDRVSYKTQ